MRKKRPIIVVIVCLIVFGFTLSSCTRIFLGLYGMKEPCLIDENTIYNYGKKYNIPNQDIYELDTSYFTFLFDHDTTKYLSQIKNHYQPLQVLYYNNEGYLESFHINCYAGGFPNLRWNRNDIFSSFLPKQQAPVDSIVSLDKQIQHFTQLSQTEKFSNDDYDYIVIVFWNKFMGRQSKRLIKTVQENSKLATEQKVKLIYVNNDNIFDEKE